MALITVLMGPICALKVGGIWTARSRMRSSSARSAAESKCHGSGICSGGMSVGCIGGPQNPRIFHRWARRFICYIWYTLAFYMTYNFFGALTILLRADRRG